MSELDIESLKKAIHKVSKESTQKYNQDSIQPEPPKNATLIYSDKDLIKNIDDKDRLEWIVLRTKYANKIYWLLLGEIVFVCLIIGIDGFSLFSFKVNEWLLGSVFYGVLTHTFFLVRTIVKNLFTR